MLEDTNSLAIFGLPEIKVRISWINIFYLISLVVVGVGDMISYCRQSTIVKAI